MHENDYQQSGLQTAADSGDALDDTQEMQGLEILSWRGGENFFEGPHDEFCFVCGSPKSLIECQTCSTCYHADCMTPSRDPFEVPNFWFCPHCVDRDWHVPPISPTSTYLGSSSLPGQVYPSPISTVTSERQVVNRSDTTHAEVLGPEISSDNLQASDRDISYGNDIRFGKSKTEKRPVTHITAPKSNPSRPKRSHSPPKKKSKYSAFSSDVDKALSVIHKELETAAEIGRSEESLRDRIQALEQQLKLKDGQAVLISRELELTKKGCVECRRLRTANQELQDLNKKLGDSVARKDAELMDWRTKLKTMIGMTPNDG